MSEVQRPYLSTREAREQFEETPEDRESRTRLALIYAEEHATQVPTLPFREWSRERISAEMRPQWEGGWSKC